MSVKDNQTGKKYKCEMGIDEELLDLLNKQHEEIQQVKQDNNALIRFLENQSIIIQKLHSKLLEYQLKEPIMLTKEDLEIMGKAISYYSRGDI